MTWYWVSGSVKPAGKPENLNPLVVPWLPSRLPSFIINEIFCTGLFYWFIFLKRYWTIISWVSLTETGSSEGRQHRAKGRCNQALLSQEGWPKPRTPFLLGCIDWHPLALCHFGQYPSPFFIFLVWGQLPQNNSWSYHPDFSPADMINCVGTSRTFRILGWHFTKHVSRRQEKNKLRKTEFNNINEVSFLYNFSEPFMFVLKLQG